MNLIDRYVFAVTEYLSDKNRKDVADELRSNIEDMLPDQPTDQDIRKVLEKMGNPRKLAHEYNPTKRYLIGPTLFDSYISLLKLVTGIVVSVILGITIFTWVLNFPESSNYVSLITDLISNTIGAVVQAAVWVTLIYAILERTGVSEGEMPFSKKDWTVNDLPTDVVPPSKKISRAETGLSLFFTLLFVSVLYFNPNLIAMYIHENSTKKIIPLFSEERLALYLSAIILITLVQLAFIVWKFIQNKWNLPLAIANVVQNIASCILISCLLLDKQIINQEFFNGIADIMNISATQIINRWYHSSVIVVIIVIIVISVWDCISAFIKAKK